MNPPRAWWRMCWPGMSEFPRSPLCLLVVLTVSTFLFMGAIQYIFHTSVTGMSPQAHGILSSLILTVTMFPVLYGFVFRPNPSGRRR